MGIYFVPGDLAQISVILAQQDIFMSLVPVNRRRLKNLNSILVALKQSDFEWGPESPVRGSCPLSLSGGTENQHYCMSKTRQIRWFGLSWKLDKEVCTLLERVRERIKPMYLDLTGMTCLRGFQNFIGNEYSEIPSGFLSLSLECSRYPWLVFCFLSFCYLT